MEKIQEDKYFVVEQEGEHLRRYHTRLRLLDVESGINIVSARTGMTWATTADGRVFDLPGIVLLLLEIKGVQAVTVTPYVVDVLKQHPFSWEEIDGAMLHLMQAVGMAMELPEYIAVDGGNGYIQKGIINDTGTEGRETEGLPGDVSNPATEADGPGL